VTPTLAGRIQTRLFMLATVGVVLTALIAPVLPGTKGGLGATYKAAFVMLLAVALVGVVWELLYHLLMQFRWDKNWPTLFGLVTIVPEGVVMFLLLRAGVVPGIGGGVAVSTFATMFVFVWIGVWLVSNGPLRVPFVQWRLRGGRLL
jgi:heme/copper-type cytochrome/quinol oxidase subunit 4